MKHIKINKHVESHLARLRVILNDVVLNDSALNDISKRIETAWGGGELIGGAGCGGCGSNCMCTCSYYCEASCSGSCSNQVAFESCKYQPSEPIT